MARLNTHAVHERGLTHEGGSADSHVSPLHELEIAVASCLLWEPTFYESGEERAQRIRELCDAIIDNTTGTRWDHEVVVAAALGPIAQLAVKARHEYKLRHVPLFLCVQLVRQSARLKKLYVPDTRAHSRLERERDPKIGYYGTCLVGDTITSCVQRPDELAEFLALYWAENPRKGRKQTGLSKQVKRGLANAYARFNEYQFAKWDRDSKVKLRDVMFLSHPKPTDLDPNVAHLSHTRAERKREGLPLGMIFREHPYPSNHTHGVIIERTLQEQLWRRLVDKQLATPDTWEVAISAAKNDDEKRDAWERLLAERGLLGYHALLQNLRNMVDVGVNDQRIEKAIEARVGARNMLPFRFLTAAKAAPRFDEQLSTALIACCKDIPKLTGRTGILVDVSGSMDAPLSAKSILLRHQAAAGLAALLREVCSDGCSVYTFSQHVVEVPARRGLALVDAIDASQLHASTYLAGALTSIKAQRELLTRMIVVTDEQSHDGIIPAWTQHAYLINVAGYKPALDTHTGWDRLSGFSERVVDWIRALETIEAPPAASEVGQ